MITHAMFAIIRVGIDPVAIHLGSGGVHWYGIMYVVAFWAAYRFGARPYADRFGIPRHQAERLCAWTIAFGLIGGRLYYVVQNNPWWYLQHPLHIFAVWEGGMAFFGAIAAGVATLIVGSRRMGLPTWAVLDGGALFAVIGQPIGRIGNVINGDILGSPSTLPWATAYTNPAAVLQNGFSLCTPEHCIAYQPAALYEALGTLLIAIVLFALRSRVRPGVVIITYVALYSLSQLLLFTLRASEPVVAFGLKQAQLTAIVILVVIVPLMIAAWRKWTPGEARSVLVTPVRA